MRRRASLFALIAMLGTTFSMGGPVAAQTERGTPQRISGSIEGFDLRSPDDVVQVFIQLAEPSVAQFAADTGAGAAAQKAQGSRVIAQQGRLRSDLSGFIVEERSNLVVGANGLRVTVRAGDIPAIRATEGVKSVAAVTRYHPDNDTSVPAIGSDTVQSSGFTGEGTTIAVIDTGIDYTHASFNMPDPGDTPSFSDVPADHLFNREIVWLSVQDITRGCNPPTNNLFCPGDDVTRGQMAAFLNRALDLAPTSEDFFNDDAGSVFENDINELAAAGITKGCNPPANDQFCPERPVSRAEMATFMVRGFGFTAGGGSDLFDDDDGNIHEFAIDQLGTAEVTRGCNPPENTNFCPDRSIIRGEMAAFIFRAFEAAGLTSEPVPPDTGPWPGEEAYADNDTGVIEPGTFPTAKVVGGFDFAGPVYDAGSEEPSLFTPNPDGDPLDVAGHGTHVAATAAGMVPASGTVGAGVAPGASLLALKVFGDVAGSTDLVSDAIEFALDPNNDLSLDDAVDVINLSLGSDFGHPQDPSAIASQNAVDMGVVVVASAGNSGDVPYVTGSPAVADGAISVAASTDAGVTLLGISVNSPASVAGEYEAAAGDFGRLDPPTTGDLAVAEPLDACTPVVDMTGKIALIQRGTCDFTTKVRNAENAGAIGALVFNNVAGAPIGMAHNGTDPQPVIPAVMIGLDDGTAIHDVAVGEVVNVTLSSDVQIPRPELADTMAGFTSRGPGYGSVFKPDLSAPGFSISSADVGTGDGAALNSGTSMAAPHVAGAAALMVQAHPELEPAGVKAMLMNSARPALPSGSVALATQGTGIVQIDRAALDLGGYAAPGGVSFGRLNPTEAGTETATIDLTRLSGAGEATYDVELVSNQTLPGVTWDLSANSVTTAGGAGSVDVSVTVDPAAMTADDGFFSEAETDGWVRFTNQADPADTMVVGLLAVADPAAQVEATGGQDSVSLDNAGPADGFADGYTLISEGDETTGSFHAIGYRTSTEEGEEGEEDDYDVIEFGLALDQWAHPSALEVDIFIDLDGDDIDDYVLVAADLGVLSGLDPTGEWVTVLENLATGDPELEYFAVADLNDTVANLPVDLTGAFGFNPTSDEFDIDVVVFDQLGLAGLVENLPVDLDDEITSKDPLAGVIPANQNVDIDIDSDTDGDMLWLFSENIVGNQWAVVEID